MSQLTCALTVSLVVSALPAWAQHEGHTTPAAPVATVNQQQVAACVQSQQQVMTLVEAGNRRLEMARQTNDPVALRTAVDDFQATLSAVRTQLGSCVELAAAMPATDPHAGHAAPSVAQPATQSSPAAPTAADPHAGHTASTAPSATQSQPAPARNAGNLDITFRTVPAAPRAAAANQFEVTVKDRQGKPVDGAEVSVALYMPAMPAMKMPEMRNEVKLKGTGNGRYVGAGQVMMAGAWTVTVSVKQNGKEIGQQKVTMTAK
ncbi:MAG TPA: FixH family protein [Vicinamibacterales bacterium]|nr:FixH family protein [Vicinamibacterales bacterium]